MKKLIAVLLIVVMATGIAGCQSKESTTGESSAATTQTASPEASGATLTGTGKDGIQRGGTFIIAHNMEPNGWFAGVTYATNTLVYTMPTTISLLDMEGDKDGKLHLVENLSDKWTFEDDKIATFHLREAYWSDGTPITSNDVKFSFEEFLLKYNTYNKQIFKDLESIECPDDYTVRFTLSKPFSNLMDFFIGFYCPIIPAHIWKDYTGDKYTENPEYTKPTVAGGPWILDEYVSGSYVSYKPNTYYWKEGQPYLDKLIIKIIPNSSSIASALEAGEIDMAIPATLSNDDTERLRTNSNFTVYDCGKYSRYTVYYGFFNTIAENISDVRVRTALIKAIDQEKLLKDCFYGRGAVNQSCIPTGSFFNDIVITPDTTYKYDVDAANALLDEAGYPKNASGSRNLTIRCYCQSTSKNTLVTECVKSFWSKVGVDMEVNMVDNATWYKYVYQDFDFDFTLIDAGVASDFSLSANRFTKSNIGKVNGNAWGITNDRVDEIFATAASQPKDEQKKLYAELQEIIADYALGIFIQNWAPYCVSNKFGGFPGYPDMQMSTWDFVYYKGGS